jgi:hypothetical protein
LQRDPEALEEGFGTLVIDIRLDPIIECFAGLRVGVGINVTTLVNDVVSYFDPSPY